MLTRWNDFDRTLFAFDQLRRRMDRMFEDFETRELPTEALRPRVNLHDQGGQLIVEAEVPGMSESDVRVTLHRDVLTFEGERKNPAPEGYSTHRRERGTLKFARSVQLPCLVDAERVRASVKNGMLMVTLPKSPEARPRQIAVRAES